MPRYWTEKHIIELIKKYGCEEEDDKNDVNVPPVSSVDCACYLPTVSVTFRATSTCLNEMSDAAKEIMGLSGSLRENTLVSEHYGSWDVGYCLIETNNGEISGIPIPYGGGVQVERQRFFLFPSPAPERGHPYIYTNYQLEMPLILSYDYSPAPVCDFRYRYWKNGILTTATRILGVPEMETIDTSDVLNYYGKNYGVISPNIYTYGYVENEKFPNGKLQLPVFLLRRFMNLKKLHDIFGAQLLTVETIDDIMLINGEEYISWG